MVTTQGAVECTACGNVFDCTDAPVVTPGTVAAGSFSHEDDREFVATQGIPLARPYRKLATESLLIDRRQRSFRTIESRNDEANNKRSIGAVVAGFFSGFAGLALRNLVRNRRRSAFAFVAIAFGVMAVLLAGGFIEWILWATRESTIHSQLGHIQIVRAGYLEEGQAAPFNYLLPETLLGLKIETDPEVEALAPRLFFTRLLSHKETTVSSLGQGVDPTKEKALSAKVRILKGDNLST